MPRPDHTPSFDHEASHSLGPNVFVSTLFSNNVSLCLLLLWRTTLHTNSKRALYVMSHKFQTHSIFISITYTHHHKPLHSKSCMPMETYSKKQAHYSCAEYCTSQEPHISTKSDFAVRKKNWNGWNFVLFHKRVKAEKNCATYKTREFLCTPSNTHTSYLNFNIQRDSTQYRTIDKESVR